MKPIFFKLDNGLSLVMLPEHTGDETGHTCTFQLYYSTTGNELKGLSDLNNYSGMISFNRESREFDYTPGNPGLSYPQLLRLIEHIKTQIDQQ